MPTSALLSRQRPSDSVDLGDSEVAISLVDRITGWAGRQGTAPLLETSVPGTSDRERSSLAALGGLAAALAGERRRSWPEPVRSWAEAGPLPPTDLTQVVFEELSGGAQLLSQAYEDIVSGRNRRRLGTFFTPSPIVEFMLTRSEEHLGVPAVVIDPGAGVGAFSLAARRRWPSAGVVAVDVNVVTLGLLAAASGDITLVHDDYLRWASGTSVPRGGPRLWIGNPPYTRHHELSLVAKRNALEASGGLVTSGLAGLSAYFLATTLQALAPEDAICFLLPGSWTDTRYGAPLRAAIQDLKDRAVEFFGFDDKCDIFPGTRVTAMVATIGPSRPNTIQAMTTAGARVASGRVLVGRSARHSRSGDAHNALGVWLWRRKSSHVRDSIPIADIGRVRRGVATGANSYFLLGDCDRERLPVGATVPAIRRLRGIIGDRLTVEEHDRLGSLGERRWLVQIADTELLSHASIQEWLETATAAGVRQRYLVKHREPWYRVEAVQAPAVIVSPMGQQRMRAVANDVQAVPANSLYGIYLDGDPALPGRLVGWLNSASGQEALFEHARAYGAGLFKLEPRDLLAVRVPSDIIRPAVQS